MTDPLSEIEQAIQGNDTERARELLREALKNPTAGAYYLASQVALSDSQRAQFLEKALALDPFHQQAADALAGRQAIDEASLDDPEIPKTPSSTPAPKVAVSESKGRGPLEYDWRRLVPLATVGIVSALFSTWSMWFGDPSYVLLGLYLAILVVLIRSHWRRPVPKARWFYQLELLVLYLPGVLYAFLAVRPELGWLTRGIRPYAPVFLVPWALGALIGGNILLFAKVPKKKELTSSD